MADIIRGLFPLSPPGNLESLDLRNLAIGALQNAQYIQPHQSPMTLVAYLSTTCPCAPFIYTLTRPARADFFEQTPYDLRAIDEDSLILQPGHFYDFVDLSDDNPIAHLLASPSGDRNNLTPPYSYPQMDVADTHEERQLERHFLQTCHEKVIDIGSVHSGEN